MRSDIKWRILDQKSKKMKRKSFLPFAMIAMAVFFLGFVHWFALNDYQGKSMYNNVQRLSFAMADFRPLPSSSGVSGKLLLPQDSQDLNPLRQHGDATQNNHGIEKVLQNLNLSSSTFILGQIAAQHQRQEQQDIFLTSDKQFYQFLTQTFSDKIQNIDDHIDDHVGEEG